MFGFFPFATVPFASLEPSEANKKIIWGGARPWEKKVLSIKDFEEDDEEFIIMALAHQIIRMRVI